MDIGNWLNTVEMGQQQKVETIKKVDTNENEWNQAESGNKSKTKTTL